MIHLKRMAAVLVVCAAVVAASGAVSAQSAKLEKAKELFQVLQGDRMMDQMFVVATTQMGGMVREAIPAPPGEVDAIIRDEVKAALAESISELMDRVAVVYEDMFTEEELDGMLAFYKGPVGQAVITKMPAVMTHTRQMSQDWGVQLNQDLRGRIKQRLRDLGYEL